MGSKQRLDVANTRFDDVLLGMINELVEQEKSNGDYVWKKLTTEGGELVDYVVSDNLSAYPDRGYVGQYWYELHKSEGQYVWKKYIVNTEHFSVTNPQIKLVSNGIPTKVTAITSGLDLSKVTEEFFDGFLIDTATNYHFVYDDGVLYHGHTNNRHQFVCTYDPITQTIYPDSAIGLNHTATYTGTKTWNYKEYTFIDYVVSDDPNAYPNEAKQDGYWYERVEGVSGIDYGEVTVTSSSEKIYIEHNLNNTPTYCALVPKSNINLTNSNNTTLGNITNTINSITSSEYTLTLYRESSTNKFVTNSSAKVEINGNTVAFVCRNSSFPWATGTYQWVVMA